MTERCDEIAALQVLWPYSGWQAFELGELSLRLFYGVTGPRRGSVLEWA